VSARRGAALVPWLGGEALALLALPCLGLLVAGPLGVARGGADEKRLSPGTAQGE
jgi:hypothetical protein